MQLVIAKIYHATKMFLDGVICTRLALENNFRMLFYL